MNNCFVFPTFYPIFFSFKKIVFYWYGIMYLIGFLFAVLLGSYQGYKYLKWKKYEIENIICISFIGLLIGGRIGYVVFYNLYFFIEHPFEIFKIWNGGMSFHGGLLGVLIFIKIFICNNMNKKFLEITDFLIPLIPFGLGTGRLGNFINGELWGRVSGNIPWCIIFPNAKNQDILFSENYPEWKNILFTLNGLPRHPSQIYEFILEGIILFFIFIILKFKKLPLGLISSIFLIFYGIFRFSIEFFREPDEQIGLFINNIFSMGQILSFPMISLGIYLIIKKYHHK